MESGKSASGVEQPASRPEAAGQAAVVAARPAEAARQLVVRQPSTAPRHIKHVEGMRALAALVVYVNHAYAQAFHLNGVFYTPDGLLSLARFSMVAGHLAVTVFIVISGFCLALPVVAGGDRVRGGARAFMKRRVRRIIPAYYGSLALSLILIWTIIGEPTGTLWDVPILVDAQAIVSHVLLLQDLFSTSKINYVLWSIAVEWHIYFLFPLLVWGCRRWGPGVMSIVAMIVGYSLYFGFESTRIVRMNPHFLGLFTLGMLAAYVSTSEHERYVRLRQRFPWALICILAAALVAVLTVVWDVRLSTERFHWLDFPVAVTAATLLVLSTRNEGALLSRVFSWRPLVLIGTFSYSLYLIHAPLLQVLWQYALQPAGVGRSTIFVALMTAGLALVLLAAYGFYRLFEAPFMRSSTSPRRGEEDKIPAPVGLGVA